MIGVDAPRRNAPLAEGLRISANHGQRGLEVMRDARDHAPLAVTRRTEPAHQVAEVVVDGGQLDRHAGGRRALHHL